jgi:hypothetical protein
MTGTTANLLITVERWIEGTPEKQLQILPLRVRMTAVVLVRPERVELPTPWFEAKCSIQMSYGRTKKAS